MCIYVYSFICCTTFTMVADSSEDEFFVYMNSKQSKDVYTWNKGNTFTNNVSPHIHLDGEYEVALQNIIFKNDFIWIRKNDPKYYMRFTCKYTHHKGSKGGFSILYKCQVDITGECIISVIRALNIDVKNFPFSQKIISLDHEDIFVIDNTGTIVTLCPVKSINNDSFMNFETKLYMSEHFKPIFGINRNLNRFSLDNS